jgi:hypothetical protein
MITRTFFPCNGDLRCNMLLTYGNASPLEMRIVEPGAALVGQQLGVAELQQLLHAFSMVEQSQANLTASVPLLTETLVMNGCRGESSILIGFREKFFGTVEESVTPAVVLTRQHATEFKALCAELAWKWGRA